MSKRIGTLSLLIVAVIAFLTAIAHLSCLYFGPQCYAAQMAPEIIIESAINGTLLAPLGNLFVSSLFILAGCYSLSAASFFRALPATSIFMYSLAILCVIRGILGVQLAIRHPELMSIDATSASVIWLLSGLLAFFGFRAMKLNQMSKH